MDAAVATVLGILGAFLTLVSLTIAICTELMNLREITKISGMM